MEPLKDASEKAKKNKLTEKDEPNQMGGMKQEGSMKKKILPLSSNIKENTQQKKLIQQKNLQQMTIKQNSRS